jgi:hypothetical protein
MSGQSILAWFAGRLEANSRNRSGDSLASLAPIGLADATWAKCWCRPGRYTCPSRGRRPPVKEVGEPCAGERRGWFDGRALETERPRQQTSRLGETQGPGPGPAYPRPAPALDPNQTSLRRPFPVNSIGGHRLGDDLSAAEHRDVAVVASELVWMSSSCRATSCGRGAHEITAPCGIQTNRRRTWTLKAIWQSLNMTRDQALPMGLTYRSQETP